MSAATSRGSVVPHIAPLMRATISLCRAFEPPSFPARTRNQERGAVGDPYKPRPIHTLGWQLSCRPSCERLASIFRSFLSRRGISLPYDVALHSEHIQVP